MPWRLPLRAAHDFTADIRDRAEVAAASVFFAANGTPNLPGVPKALPFLRLQRYIFTPTSPCISKIIKKSS
jgi:hypothetical protein